MVTAAMKIAIQLEILLILIGLFLGSAALARSSDHHYQEELLNEIAYHPQHITLTQLGDVTI